MLLLSKNICKIPYAEFFVHTVNYFDILYSLGICRNGTLGFFDFTNGNIHCSVKVVNKKIFLCFHKACNSNKCYLYCAYYRFSHTNT